MTTQHTFPTLINPLQVPTELPFKSYPETAVTSLIVTFLKHADVQTHSLTHTRQNPQLSSNKLDEQTLQACRRSVMLEENNVRHLWRNKPRQWSNKQTRTSCCMCLQWEEGTTTLTIRAISMCPCLVIVLWTNQLDTIIVRTFCLVQRPV